jgi:hypothetical protein
MEVVDGANVICDLIQSKTPFFVGKLGTSELNILLFYIRYRKDEPTRVYPDVIRTHIAKNGGVFPATDSSIDTWAIHMINDILPAGDGYALWNPIYPIHEQTILDTFSPKSARFPLRSLEPYYVDNAAKRWTYVLGSQCIAVVSPFADTIQQQWNKRDSIWSGRSIWASDPPVLQTVRSGYGPYLTATTGKWPRKVLEGGWQAAVASVVDDVLKTRATFAIVGCGALSLPICYALKQLGVSSIHLGGATQILFGIQGKRWLQHSVISGFFNDAWIFPLAHEIPSLAGDVEGGCYWS